MGPFADDGFERSVKFADGKKTLNGATKWHARFDPWPTANEKVNLVSIIIAWLSARDHI